MTQLAIACFFCTRFHKDSDEPLTCDAFPSGIPEEIQSGANDHSKPFANDNGLQFELMEKEI